MANLAKSDSDSPVASLASFSSFRMLSPNLSESGGFASFLLLCLFGMWVAYYATFEPSNLICSFFNYGYRAPVGRRKSNEGGEPLSIRISPELRAQITEAAKALNISEHDAMRQAMRLGLRYLRSISYDVDGVLLSLAKPGTMTALASTLSEDPVPYKAGKRTA